MIEITSLLKPLEAVRDVDYILTTQELALMIKASQKAPNCSRLFAVGASAALQGL